jgi:hypothetical protein
MTNMSPHNAWTGADQELEAKAYFYLGRIYWVIGDLDEALVLFKKSKASSEVLFDPNHPWTLWSCNNLAIILTEQEKYAEACELAVNGMTATFGAEHEETLISKANHSAAMERQNGEVPSTPLDIEPDWRLLLAPNEIHTPQPMTTLPSDSIPIDPGWDMEAFPTVTSPEQSANVTSIQVDENEAQELHQQLRAVLHTFEHGDSPSLPTSLSQGPISMRLYTSSVVDWKRLPSYTDELW